MAVVRALVEKSHDSSLTTWAPVASAVIAALAALASWRSVCQARAIWRTGLLPDLHGSVVPGPHRWGIVVENTGGGLARVAAYALVADNQFDDGLLAKSGFVRPGEGVTVTTAIPVSGSTDVASIEAALFCEDTTGLLHVWSLDHEHHIFRPNGLFRRARLRLTRWRSPRGSRRAMLRALYTDPARRADIEEAKLPERG
jgi:hypothetical protein